MVLLPSALRSVSSHSTSHANLDDDDNGNDVFSYKPTGSVLTTRPSLGLAQH